MPEASFVQNNFTAGELSPRLFGRNDLGKYRNGLSGQINFLTQKHGGAVRRSGSKFVAQTKDSDGGIDRTARLIRFIFSNEQNYVLEFGHLYVRFFRDLGRLQHGEIKTVTGAVHAAGTSTLTIGAHGVQSGEQISVQGVLTTDPTFPIGYNGTFAVTGITATTVSYAQATAPPGTYSSGGTVTPTSGSIPLEKATPYTEADLPLLKVAQSADVLYIVHQNYEPRLLRRGAGADTDPATWSLVEFDAQDGPYLDQNTVTTATMSIPAAQAAGTTLAGVTWSNAAVAIINGGQGFTSGDIGRSIRWRDSAGSDWHFGTITAVAARNSITLLLGTASIIDTTSVWRLGAWCDTAGWPFSIVFHEDRLWFGGNRNQPQTLWASMVGDYPRFRPTPLTGTDAGIVTDESGITVTINDDQMNQIHWIKSDAKGVIVGTNGGIFLAASTEESTITPLNLHVVRHITESVSQRPPPRQISGVTLFIMSPDRVVREFVWRVDQEKYAAPDLTILSEHITQPHVVDTALQLDPDVVFWLCRADGTLAAMTYEREEQVVAWHRHVMGGGAAESIESLRDPTARHDHLWVIVKRIIGGVTRRHVEYIEHPFADAETIEDAFFVDAGLTFDNPIAITSIDLGASPVTVTAPGHGLMAGDRIRIRDVVGTVEVNHVSFTVQDIVGDTFGLYTLAGGKVNPESLSPYVSGGTVRKEVDQVSGLAHIAGQTAKILADGAVHPDVLVSAGGGVTLNRFASIIHVGLGYPSQLVTLPLIVGYPVMETRGRPIRVDHVIIRLYRSLGGKVGDEKRDTLVDRVPSDPMNVATPPFTGQKRVAVSARHSLDPTITIETEDPLPMNVLSLVVEAGVEAI
jgi:hypothetical protein